MGDQSLHGNQLEENNLMDKVYDIIFNNNRLTISDIMSKMNGEWTEEEVVESPRNWMEIGVVECEGNHYKYAEVDVTHELTENTVAQPKSLASQILVFARMYMEEYCEAADLDTFQVLQEMNEGITQHDISIEIQLLLLNGELSHATNERGEILVYPSALV